LSAVIETRNLTKLYPSGAGINDVSLTVERGEIFGFLGPNGAGKTTTIRTLLDLLHPTSGRALVFGLDSRRDSVAIHARLGNLPGELSSEPGLRGIDLIRSFARIRGVTDLSFAYTLAERFDASLERPLDQVSKGNLQKIGLIQALFHRPELLVLDEPTSGLDPLMQEEVTGLLGELRTAGTTIFLSSHNLPEVERVCDRVGIIKDGRLAAVETVSELTEKSYRHVTIVFSQPVDPAPFERLRGVRDLVVDGNRLAFKLTDDIDSVLKLAAGHHVLDMEIEHPTLEEVFLTYYARPDGGPT
jgi:ABC-2 type transport system ATP-binding protein